MVAVGQQPIPHPISPSRDQSMSAAAAVGRTNAPLHVAR